MRRFTGVCGTTLAPIGPIRSGAGFLSSRGGRGTLIGTLIGVARCGTESPAVRPGRASGMPRQGPPAPLDRHRCRRHRLARQERGQHQRGRLQRPGRAGRGAVPRRGRPTALHAAELTSERQIIDRASSSPDPLDRLGRRTHRGPGRRSGPRSQSRSPARRTRAPALACGRGDLLTKGRDMDMPSFAIGRRHRPERIDAAASPARDAGGVSSGRARCRRMRIWRRGRIVGTSRIAVVRLGAVRLQHRASAGRISSRIDGRLGCELPVWLGEPGLGRGRRWTAGPSPSAQWRLMRRWRSRTGKR